MLIWFFSQGDGGNPLLALNGKPIRSQKEENLGFSAMGSSPKCLTVLKGLDGVVRSQICA